jgi:hypothetical protein
MDGGRESDDTSDESCLRANTKNDAFIRFFV